MKFAVRWIGTHDLEYSGDRQSVITLFTAEAKTTFVISRFVDPSWEVRGQFFNFAPRDEILPPGVNIFPLGVKVLCAPLHLSRQYRMFTPGGEDKVYSWGQTSSLGTNFTPGDKLKLLKQAFVY
jgi:hypothetical protein